MPTREEFHKRWIDLILSVNLPKRDVVKHHLEAASRITYCDCGCHSFDLHFTENTELPPLTGGRGIFSEFGFDTNHEYDLHFILHTDEKGHLRWIDITYGDANHESIPDDIEVKSFRGFIT